MRKTKIWTYALRYSTFLFYHRMNFKIKWKFFTKNI